MKSFGLPLVVSSRFRLIAHARVPIVQCLIGRGYFNPFKFECEDFHKWCSKRVQSKTTPICVSCLATAHITAWLSAERWAWRTQRWWTRIVSPTSDLRALRCLRRSACCSILWWCWTFVGFILVNSWASNCGIINSQSGFLNSYTLYLMLIFFLQVCDFLYECQPTDHEFCF